MTIVPGPSGDGNAERLTDHITCGIDRATDCPACRARSDAATAAQNRRYLDAQDRKRLRPLLDDLRRLQEVFPAELCDIVGPAVVALLRWEQVDDPNCHDDGQGRAA